MKYRFSPILALVGIALAFAGCSSETPTANQKPPVAGDLIQPVPEGAGSGATPMHASPNASVAAVDAPDEVGPGDDFIAEDGSDLKCTPKTCEELGLDCGYAPDECGGAVNCGGCPEGQLCGGETPNICLAPPPCMGATSCAELGWECGVAIDDCGNVLDCAAEGLVCESFETCIASDNGATECVPGFGGEAGCDVCEGLPDCDGQAQTTTLTGRVITPGRSDDNVANQVGVPNAFVYILTNNNPDDLPAYVDGIPEGETACDRCEGQDLGPLLAGTATDALGNFTLEGNIPVGVEFLLVVKAGRFRRAVPVTLPETAACATTELDPLETRLARSMTDGLGVNIPRVAISTGDIDAMECVFEKMGIDHSEFGVGGDATAPERVQLYGTDGAEMPEGNPDQDVLQDDLARVLTYDMLVFGCQGGGYLNPPEQGARDNVREYVNRGGRMFASHWSYQWICSNGDTPYSADDPIATGLAPSAVFPGCTGATPPQEAEGLGLVSTGRPDANPAKIDDFAAWLVNEGAATMNADGGYEFNILQPRDLVETVNAPSEEFVYREYEEQSGGMMGGMMGGGTGGMAGDVDPTPAELITSVQQYAFNTPFGSPEEDSCGRVAYSGFHVSASEDVMNGGSNSPFANSVFPEHCVGDLTPQEKILLFMLFDLGACVGDPPAPPQCEPQTCEAVDAECGLINDGCGTAVDCGPCPEGEICGLFEPNKCGACVPYTCDEVDIECGFTGDGCGGVLTCECPSGLQCGFPEPNLCGRLDVAN